MEEVNQSERYGSILRVVFIGTVTCDVERKGVMGKRRNKRMAINAFLPPQVVLSPGRDFPFSPIGLHHLLTCSVR